MSRRNHRDRVVRRKVRPVARPRPPWEQGYTLSHIRDGARTYPIGIALEDIPKDGAGWISLIVAPGQVSGGCLTVTTSAPCDYNIIIWGASS